MVTPQFLGFWFMFATIIFLGLIQVEKLRQLMDTERSMNTAMVLFAQGLGALAAYALHS